MIKISKEDARGLAEMLPSSRHLYTTEGGAHYEVVVNRDHAERRWTMTMELVIRASDGQLFRAFYERGLTENQYESPFEYDGDLIEFERVIGQPRQVIDYVKWTA